MLRLVERHVPAVTGLLTVVSLALVFAAALWLTSFALGVVVYLLLYLF